MIKTIWIVLAIIPALLALASVSIAPAQQAEDLIGKWEGQWSNPRFGEGAYKLTIKEVRGEQALGIVFFDNCGASYCNQDLPFTGVVRGPKGKETLQLTFAGSGTASIVRKGDQMEGTSGVRSQSAVTLTKVK